MSSKPAVIQDLFDLQKYAIKLGLDNVRFLCEALDNPQDSYPVIHIAGTNGKGSTSFFIAALLQESGLRVGLFTSPHLVDFRERIRVSGKKITLDFISDFWQAQMKTIHERQATFFDTSAALAFTYFRDQKVDVAVVETGLGGRLDSTNIVQSEIAVITPIHFDHEKQLGNSLEAIAAEKAGIIKQEVVVFSAPQNEKVLQVLKNKLGPKSTFFYVPEFLKITVIEENLSHTEFDFEDALQKLTVKNIHSRQLSGFQAENQALACSVSQYFLQRRGKSLSKVVLRKVFEEHIWPGRLQRISTEPDIFFDVSHNTAGIKRTLDFMFRHIPRQNLCVLVGLVADKNYAEIAEIIARSAWEVVLCEPDTHRRLEAEVLSKAFKQVEKTTQIIKDSQKAYEFCKNNQSPGQVLLVIGSHYLIGSLLDKGN